MGVVLIDIRVTNERVQVPVVADHYWYDVTEKKMLKMSGGSLAFRYTGNKMTVTTQPLFATKYQSGHNKSQIMEWYDNNKEAFRLNILDGGVMHIALSFNDTKLQEMEESLYARRFEYEILSGGDKPSVEQMNLSGIKDRNA